jgi:hypothetical protein
MDGTHDLLKAIESHTAITIEQVADIFQVSAETIRGMPTRNRLVAHPNSAGADSIRPASATSSANAIRSRRKRRARLERVVLCSGVLR